MFFRQTNILWSTFFAILRAFEFVGQPIWSFTGFCSLFKDEVGYIVNALLFVGFAIVNNGIVLGDRKNHAARFHIPQLFYCLTTIVLLALPILDPKGLISSLLDSLRHHYITWTLSFILHICCVRYLT